MEDSPLAEGGYVAFHDYATYYPGAMTFVNKLLAGGRYGTCPACPQF
jgi:hypothetical protein